MTAKKDTSAMLYRMRIIILCIVVFALFSLLQPALFPTAGNIGNIMRATSIDALAAAGFTIVMLSGQLDLSIGSTMTLGGTIVMMTQPILGWFGAVALAAAAGALVGLFNGTLVSKLKINSFIVTLGTMTILQGLTRSMLSGGSCAAGEAGMAMSDWLLPNRILFIFVPVLLLELAMRKTKWGRNLYLIGGNKQTAWQAGIKVDWGITSAFLLCGVFSAVGGAFSAMTQNCAMPNLGDKTLMLVVAATIVGGTSMAGGTGRVMMTMVALFTLNSLTNGLSYMGASKSIKLIAHGVVLASVIISDAWREVQRDRLRGQRRELMDEAEQLKLIHDEEYELEYENNNTEDSDMSPRRKDNSLLIVCVTAIACVSIVAIFAMNNKAPVYIQNGAASAIDPLSVKATDGQPLVWEDTTELIAPERPADPETLADDDILRWYDHEYAGWSGKKLPMPESPGDGPQGKKVVSLQYMNHPYWTGYNTGMKRMAKAYDIDLTTMEAGNDTKAQMDQVEQAIAMKPDLVILTPVDANAVVPMLKRLYKAKIPVITSNLLPIDDAMQYCITWTGPDDWGQMRMLAHEMAEAMNNKGNYCVIRHVAGTSCFLSRTWAPISELKKIAPEMKCLDMQATDLDAEKTKIQVAAWIKKYGDDLNAIVSADDSKAQLGIEAALQDAGRTDIVCVSAGSCKTGLELVKAGRVQAISYQSAEGDGALPVYIAAKWFDGDEIDRPVYYIKKDIITKENVEDYLPAQW